MIYPSTIVINDVQESHTEYENNNAASLTLKKLSFSLFWIKREANSEVFSLRLDITKFLYIIFLSYIKLTCGTVYNVK